jgi:hypothetical protein
LQPCCALTATLPGALSHHTCSIERGFHDAAISITTGYDTIKAAGASTLIDTSSPAIATMQECKSTTLQDVQRKCLYYLDPNAIVQGDLLFMPMTPQPSLEEISQWWATALPAVHVSRGGACQDPDQHRLQPHIAKQTRGYEAIFKPDTTTTLA